jgi:hypothetical protein
MEVQVSKKSEVLASLVEVSKEYDRLGSERSAARVEQVAWCYRASYVGKATDEEMGAALTEAGVSLKRASAGRYKWIGSVVHAELATGVDAASLSADVARMVAALNFLVSPKGIGKGAGAIILENLRGVDSCEAGAIILESLCPEVDPGAILLAKILALTTEYVEQNYVPGDLDAMVEIQRNVATMSGRA